ncbi:MAG: thioesterase family protein [Chloroflexi bacterium]|nr:thioesterase family protein [Chloroflexota bacterium]
MPDPVPVEVPIPIRWRDLDALGHVNNAVYLTYFEVARLGYIRALLGDDIQRDPRTLLPVGFQFILAEVTCSFRSPATLSDRLIVAIWVSQVGRKSFVFEYRISDEVTGRLVAEGCSTQVWYDYAAGESRTVPAEVVERMERMQGVAIPRA